MKLPVFFSPFTYFSFKQFTNRRLGGINSVDSLTKWLSHFNYVYGSISYCKKTIVPRIEMFMEIYPPNNTNELEFYLEDNALYLTYQAKDGSKKDAVIANNLFTNMSGFFTTKLEVSILPN